MDNIMASINFTKADIFYEQVLSKLKGKNLRANKFV